MSGKWSRTGRHTSSARIVSFEMDVSTAKTANFLFAPCFFRERATTTAPGEDQQLNALWLP